MICIDIRIILRFSDGFREVYFKARKWRVRYEMKLEEGLYEWEKRTHRQMTEPFKYSEEATFILIAFRGLIECYKYAIQL